MNNQDGKQQLSHLVEQTNSIVNSGKNPMQIMRDMNIPLDYIRKVKGFLNTPLIGNAIFNYAERKGYKKEDFVQMCLIADSSSIASPCGACRQVISEFFLKETPIILVTVKGESLITNIGELLPYGFDEGNLK